MKNSISIGLVLATLFCSESQAQNAPQDFSANAAAVPIATFVLLATVPVSASRWVVNVQNQSAAMIQVVRDDGSATSGTISSVLLAPGSGANTAGQTWTSTTFKGRVRVYGATGAQVSAFQE